MDITLFVVEVSQKDKGLHDKVEILRCFLQTTLATTRQYIFCGEATDAYLHYRSLKNIFSIINLSLSLKTLLENSQNAGHSCFYLKSCYTNSTFFLPVYDLIY